MSTDSLLLPSIYQTGGLLSFKSSSFPSEVSDIVSEVKYVVRDILGPNHGGEGSQFPLSKPKHYEEVFWLVVNAVTISFGGKGRDSDIRAIAGVMFGLLTVISTYYWGKEWAERCEAQEGLEKAIHAKTTVHKYQEGQDPNHPIRKITDLQERIFSRTKKSTDLRLVFKTVLLASAVLGVGGAVGNVYVIVVVATTVGSVAGGALLGQAGLDNTDRKNWRDAQTISGLLPQLENSTQNAAATH